MDECKICKKAFLGAEAIVTLRKKGCEGIARASLSRGDDIHTEPGQQVHKECRKVYCNENEIAASKRKSAIDTGTSAGEQRILRSARSPFVYKEHCLFCGGPDTFNHRRPKEGHKLVRVQTDQFHSEITTLCDEREDVWSHAVRGRLNNINDPFSADVVYHQVCSVNFRTNKRIPQQFRQVNDPPPAKRGRPQNVTQMEAFLKVATYLQENDDEQTTIHDLIDKMQEFLVDSSCMPYNFTYMKDQLTQHFSDSIVVAEINGKTNVVTLRNNASKILQDFYCQSKGNNTETDKLRIIQTAAKLIKTDIQSVSQATDDYPSCEELSSIEESIAYLPESLRMLLDVLFPSKGGQLKLASLGQAIMQATRPRVLLAPLQVGLGVQLHHHFASRFLIDTLSKLGFCSSYSEVAKFGRNAAITDGTDIPNLTAGHFVQYVADNVDHNVRTIDGMGTFHGMGMIAAITPQIKRNQHIPRGTVSADEISAVGTVNIVPFMPMFDGLRTLCYEKLHIIEKDDPTSRIDDLWQLSFSVRSPRPAWSGFMQMIHKGDHPGQSSVVFLPMIDMDPGNMSCVSSTLHFIGQHAQRYGVTPIITFDQPLWWKALQVIRSQPANSPLHCIVLRLGGFHTEMSFIGCIGHLMAGSGLQEMLETIYASNTVNHMLSGKAIERAVRGLFLVDSALNGIIVSDVFSVKTPCIEAKSNRANRGDFSVAGDIPVECNMDHTVPESTSEPDDDCKADLEAVGILFDELLSGNTTFSQVHYSEAFTRIHGQLEAKKRSMKNSRTARLWLQFMEMVQILRKFLKGERLGIWDLHIQAMVEMLPYLAASGHNLYTKSLSVYLQYLVKLSETAPDIFQHFSGGLHVVRRSDRLWAGLSADLVIEQVLMRSMKTTGGLTRGRGMTETQRLIWLMAHPHCSEVNNAMQQLTGINYTTNEQHKDTTHARQERDMADICELVEFLETRNPFSGAQGLRNIVTGINADGRVNVDTAKDVGQGILDSMVGKSVLEHTFRKKDQAVTLNTSVIKINHDMVNIDPQLLFQRLVTMGTRNDQLQEIFRFELCSYPPALFEGKQVLRSANKPALADAIWSLIQDDMTEPVGQSQYVLDGGSLLHRIPWQRGSTYDGICERYTNYVTRKYGKAVIVFDGYENDMSTKDGAHQRRTSGREGPKVDFNGAMPMKSKKEEFLSNKDNKQSFIRLLSIHLEQMGCKTHHAEGDADVLIVQTAIESAGCHQTIVVGDDTDLLVLLCFHTTEDSLDIFFRPEGKTGTKKQSRCWNIKHVQRVLGEEVCQNILFTHAILGCDTTSRLFGLGKGLALKQIRTDVCFRAQAKVFLDGRSTLEDTAKAGESALVSLYKGSAGDTLDKLRLERFQQKVATSASCVRPENLPPTSSAAKFHSLRVYHQVQVWKGVTTLDPQIFGWKAVEGKLVPVQCDMEVAPKTLLQIVRCNCKMGCQSMRCSCRQAGLDCSTCCGECRGICTNMSEENTDGMDDM